MVNKIIWLFCGITLFLGLSPTLLRADTVPPQLDLYMAIHNCNEIKHNVKSGYATDEQLNHAIEIVRHLLRTGANPNMRVLADEIAIIRGYGLSLWYMKGGVTLLMLSRVARVSELLIEYGARVNDQDNYGRTALMISAFFDNYHAYNDNNIITKMLLRNNANVNIQNNTGQTALHYAIYAANIEAIGLFVSKGANVNLRDNKGWSPLIAANICYFESTTKINEEITQILMNAGATINDNDMQLINSLKEEYILWDEELKLNGADR